MNKTFVLKRLIPVTVCLVMVITVAAVFCIKAGFPGSYAAQAADLMDGILPGDVSGKPADDDFTVSMADFSVELFKKSIKDRENSLISPLSVTLALSMTANGAHGETLAQMEQLLGGSIPLDELNRYLYSYVKELPGNEKAKLNIANSIWFRDDESLSVQPDFLQTNADYYGAAAYKSAFDQNTLRDINNWAEDKTDGMIDSILYEIDDDAVLYLINAIAFDAEWENVYNLSDVYEADFTDINGSIMQTEFMCSEEYRYLDDGRATGFLKPYAEGQYNFAALLPNEDVAIEDYVATLTGAELINTINDAEDITVFASLPKFSYEYAILMNDALESLRIPDAFDGDLADFKKMATSTRGNIFIGRVIHKAFISVDELGTKAGAATMVQMECGGMPEGKTVQLDRPFVYAIVDNTTGLPVFIGTVMTV